MATGEAAILKGPTACPSCKTVNCDILLPGEAAHKLCCTDARHDSCSWKESSNPIGKKSSRSLWIWHGILLPSKASFLNEEEDQDERKPNRTNSPPKSIWPKPVLNNKTPDRRTRNNTKQQAKLLARERLPTLMQKEYVHDVGRTDHRGQPTEETSHHSRHDERDVIIGTRHGRRPDLADDCEKQTPQHDGASAKHPGQREEDDRPCEETGNCCWNRIGELDWSFAAVCNSLRDVGQLVRDGRERAGEGGKT